MYKPTIVCYTSWLHCFTNHDCGAVTGYPRLSPAFDGFALATLRRLRRFSSRLKLPSPPLALATSWGCEIRGSSRGRRYVGNELKMMRISGNWPKLLRFCQERSTICWRKVVNRHLKGTAHVSGPLHHCHKSRGLSRSSPVHVRPGSQQEMTCCCRRPIDW